MRKNKPSECTNEGDFCQAENKAAGITIEFQYQYSQLIFLIRATTKREDVEEGLDVAAMRASDLVDPDAFFEGFKAEAQANPANTA